MHPDQVAQIIKKCQKTGRLPDGSRRCLLCSDSCPHEPMYVGVWIAEPSIQRRIGFPEEKLAKGGRRVVMYQLCPSCFERPTRTEDVEAELLKQVSVQ